jgi:hypothetical protein
MPPVPPRAVAQAKSRHKLQTGQPQRRQPWFKTILLKLHLWTNQEIISDDPWDVDTLFPDADADSEPKPPAQS